MTLLKSSVTAEKVLIKVKACSINAIDVKIPGGVYDRCPLFKDQYYVVGFDRSNVKELKRDDEVYFLANMFN